jgi:hypothetical protein
MMTPIETQKYLNVMRPIVDSVAKRMNRQLAIGPTVREGDNDQVQYDIVDAATRRKR